MAAPTITGLTPSVGPPGGRTLLQITGTNFQLGFPPPSTGPTPRGGMPPSVKVTFGGLASPLVMVVSSTVLYAVSPRCPLRDSTEGMPIPGPVDVIVTNIDVAGTPLAGGASAPAVNAFLYRRPALSGLVAESILNRVARAMRRELSLQVLENTTMTVSTDWTTDPTNQAQPNYIAVASLPALTVMGPQLSRHTGDRNGVPTYVVVDGVFKRRRPTRLYDAQFDLVGIANKESVLVNLMGACCDFFDRYPLLYVDRDQSDPSAGQIPYEVDITPGQDFAIQGTPDDSNLRHFRGAFTIRAIDLEDLPDFVDDAVVDRGSTIQKVTIGSGQPS